MIMEIGYIISGVVVGAVVAFVISRLMNKNKSTKVVQQAIDEAINKTDFILMNQLLEILKKPYADQPEHGEYMDPPKENERVHQTFCGT